MPIERGRADYQWNDDLTLYQVSVYEEVVAETKDESQAQTICDARNTAITLSERAESLLSDYFRLCDQFPARLFEES